MWASVNVLITPPGSRIGVRGDDAPPASLAPGPRAAGDALVSQRTAAVVSFTAG